MKKLKKYLLLLLLPLIFAISCDKNTAINESTTKDDITNSFTTIKDHQINIEHAQVIAPASFLTLNNNLKTTNLKKKKLKNKKTYYDENGLPALHILNYDNDGQKSCIIISGDDRLSPIQAFSENTEFNFDVTIPAGISHWLNLKIRQINYLRKNKVKQDEKIKNLWVTTYTQILPIGDEDPPEVDPEVDPCGDIVETYTMNPLLQTYWGQRCVYNTLCPAEYSELDLMCPGLPCGHANTGCVATAMAQIMRFHEYPSTYNWDDMQNTYIQFDFNDPGANDVAQLMADIGDAVNMDYECSGSGATSGIIDNDFDYDLEAIVNIQP